MKRSSSAAKLPQAMSNKLICLHIEFLFMAKCSTWHVDNVFINAFRLKFRLSNSTSPKTACSSKIPKTKKIWKLFRACADKSLPCYAACYNIKSILNANWSSKQNNQLAIRLKRFHGRFGRSIEIVIKITFQKLYLTNPKICRLETKT